MKRQKDKEKRVWLVINYNKEMKKKGGRKGLNELIKSIGIISDVRIS